MAIIKPKTAAEAKVKLPSFKGSSHSNVNIAYDGVADAFPDVDPGVRPCGDLIIVQLRKPKSVTKGGIIVPEDTRQTINDNTQVGRVVALGPVAFRDRKTLEFWPEGPWAKLGDFVRMPKYGGDRWQVKTTEGDEITFITMKDMHLIGEYTADPLQIKAYV